MRASFFLLCVAFGLSSWHGLQASDVSEASSAYRQNGVTAHRGNSADFPENTLEAFQSAIEPGADWIELDLFRTSDGQIVVTHDKSTARVGDRELIIGDSTYQQLLTVDVASDFRKRHQLSIEQRPPARIPLLEDVLRLVAMQSQTRVSLQPKVDCVAEAAVLIQKWKMDEQTGFNDGNLQFMIQAKALVPKATIFWDRGPNTDLESDIKIAKEHQFHALILRSDGLTSAKIEKVKAAGLEVGAWTVNDPEEMKKLLGWGTDRIYTDDPRTLLYWADEARRSRKQ